MHSDKPRIAPDQVAHTLLELGGQIRRLRLDRSLHGGQLADLAGVVETTFRKMEMGSSCALRTFVATAIALGRSEWLAGLAGTASDTPVPSNVDAAVMTLGAQVRALRTHQGLELETLAAKAGLSAQKVTSIEEGQPSSLLPFVAVVHALSRSPWLRSLDPSFEPALVWDRQRATKTTRRAAPTVEGKGEAEVTALRQWVGGRARRLRLDLNLGQAQVAGSAGISLCAVQGLEYGDGGTLRCAAAVAWVLGRGNWLLQLDPQRQAQSKDETLAAADHAALFGAQVRRLRLQANMTQQQLAAASNLAVAGIRSVERGKCTLKNAIAVACALGRSQWVYLFDPEYGRDQIVVVDRRRASTPRRAPAPALESRPEPSPAYAH